MESNSIDSSVVGEYVTVVVDCQVDSFHNLIKYRCQNLEHMAKGWDVFLTSPQDETHAPNEEVTGWIFDFDDRHRNLTVTTHNRGRADLHSLRKRHKNAANHIAQLSTVESPAANDIDEELVSHAKGLLSRCVRKDRWDWYTVFALLKKPSNSTLEHGRQLLSELRTASENGNDDEVGEKIRVMTEIGLSGRFAEFVRAVNHGEEFEAVDDEYLLKKLTNITWEEFEYFLRDIWKEMGWEAERNDDDAGGGDVIARKPQLNLRVDIEAKQREPERNIPLSDVQRYMTMATRKETDRAILVTTGGFTRPAWREAERNEFTLMDGEKLLEQIRSEGLYHVVKKYTD